MNILAYKNTLKLTYGKVEFQKFSPGEKPPDPRSKGRPRLTRPGGAAASNAARAGEGKGEGRGGEGRRGREGEGKGGGVGGGSDRE